VVTEMKSLLMGFETPGMQNDGRNFYMRVAEPMTLAGIEVDCAMAPLGGPTGFAEMFVFGVLLDKAPVFVPGASGFINIPAAPGFDTITHYPPGVDFRGGNVSKGGLFGFILKEEMPRGCSKTCYVPLGLTAIAGNYILIHADHWGAGPMDFELQATMTYF
jgi:hypothetical protein